MGRKIGENRSHRMSHSSVDQLPEFSTQPLASGGGSAGASVAVSWHSAVESDIGKGSGTGSSSLSSEATTKKPRWHDEKCKMHWNAIYFSACPHADSLPIFPEKRNMAQSILSSQTRRRPSSHKARIEVPSWITIKKNVCWCQCFNQYILDIHIYIY